MKKTIQQFNNSTIQQIDYFKFSWIWLCLIMLPINILAQEAQSFYVVEKQNETIEPTQKTTLPDGTLSLIFEDKELNDFFNTKTVYQYKIAFHGTNSELLKRVYFVSFNESDNLNFDELSMIDFVAEIPDFKPLEYPNDYDLEIPNIATNPLDLVRAPLAWEITKGDNPNIMIGIADIGFNPNHVDLQNNIYQHIGYSTTNGQHGTRVAGFASAVTDNGVGISSIGYNTKLVTTSGSTMQTHLIAQIPGVRVVNTSWGFGCINNPNNLNTINEEVYREIWEDFGVVVVSAAGNGDLDHSNLCDNVVEGTESTAYVYPAAYDYTISVSSVGTTFPHGYVYTRPSDGTDHLIEWNDCHQLYIDYSNPESGTHQHNDKVDIVAPGYVLRGGLTGQTDYQRSSGTSYAAPQVAAAAALVLSVNPNLTPDEVRDILKNTADDIYWLPCNQAYQGLLGAGRLNVFRAVKTAECQLSDTSDNTLDLMIKDSKDDVGDEPNLNTSRMWTSSDIWVRNQNDGKITPVHQNPTYSSSEPNYIYVRVTNLSCQTTTGTETVSVNWAKANTALQWPENWDGSLQVEDAVMGGVVGTGTIPPLAPGQEGIVEIPWYVPNPDDYVGINDNPWHFCLLANINATNDPLTTSMTPNPNHMVRENNNLAWKNVTVIDVNEDSNDASDGIGAVVGIANPSDIQRTFILEFVKEDVETGKPIYEEAEVGIKMDQVLHDAWERGGKIASETEDTNVDNKKIAKGHVLLENLQLNPNEYGTLYLSFNFLTKELSEKRKYRYHVIQKDATTGEVIGGETFEINKRYRQSFYADAGNTREIKQNEEITLSAEQLFEAAKYNWYDEDGNLVYTGKDFEVSPEITTKYKLEVIAKTDGFKDYAEVEVKVEPYQLISLSPNPANTLVTVNYNIENTSSAYLIVTEQSNGVSNNYILSPNSDSKLINLNNYAPGYYIVTLVCDGQIINSKHLIKN